MEVGRTTRKKELGSVNYLKITISTLKNLEAHAFLASVLPFVHISLALFLFQDFFLFEAVFF